MNTGAALLRQNADFYSEVGWSALVDHKPEVKLNKHLGRVHGGHSVPILTFSHWFIQEEMSTYAFEFLQMPWRSFCLALLITWNKNVQWVIQTSHWLGHILLEEFPGLRSKEVWTVPFFDLYCQSEVKGWLKLQHSFFLFPAVLLQETSLLKTGWVHGCEFCFSGKVLHQQVCLWVFSPQPLCRFGMRWETWGLHNLFKHSSPKILHFVCDYVVQLFVLPVFSFG